MKKIYTGIAVPLALASVLSACGGNTPPNQGNQPSPTTSVVRVIDETTTTITPTTTIAPQPVDLEPTLENILVNGIALMENNGVFTIGDSVNAGDKLEIKIEISDDESGYLNINGERQTYQIENNSAEVLVSIEIPASMSAAQIPITLGESNYLLSFSPGIGFIPSITVEVNEENYAGDTLIIPLSAVDIDNEEVTVTVEQILGLGDRYEGNEYVTSQILDDLTLGEDTITVRSDTPGNYRIRIIATSGTDETVEEIDVPITWAPGENPFEIQGVSIDFWGPPGFLDFDLVPELIQKSEQMGANSVQLVPYWWASSVTANEIIPCEGLAADHCKTPSDDQIVEWIRLTKDLDMSVTLAPHYNVGTFNVGYEAESWSNEPSNPSEWFESYTDFMTHYAMIAEEEGVEILVIGKNISGTHLMTEDWENMISQIRSVYSGEIAYVDPGLFTDSQNNSKFWGSLDIIGVPYYYPASNGDDNPSMDEMVQFIQEGVSVNLEPTMNKYEIPAISFETGAPNFDGVNYEFWRWENRVQDNQEIIDYVEAQFLTQLNLEGDFEGNYMWVLQPRSEIYPIDGNFIEQPLWGALEFWFSE